jgi:indolepyruvate ferredoxin oxidoreductase
MIDHKRFAAEAFARANRSTAACGASPARRSASSPRARTGSTSSTPGASGHRRGRGRAARPHAYKVGQTFPMDMTSFHEWADGLDLIVVVEEKRKLIEVQIKEAIFDDRRAAASTAGSRAARAGHARAVPDAHGARPVMIAEKIGAHPDRGGPRRRWRQGRDATHCGGEDIRQRPRSRAGCPTSARAARTTPRPRCPRARAPMRASAATTWSSGWTARPKASPTWGARARTGSARRRSRPAACLPEPRRRDLQPLGRAGDPRALAAGGNEHHLQDPLQRRRRHDRRAAQRRRAEGAEIARELKAMGVKHVAVVYDPKEDVDPNAFPRGTDMHERADLPRAEEIPRDRGRVGHRLHPDLRGREAPPPQARPVPRPRPPRLHQHRRLRGLRRLRRQSNCVSIVPVETELGPQARHRPVVLQQGLLLRERLLPVLRDGGGREDPQVRDRPRSTCGHLPEPDLPAIHGTHNVVVTGVGGTGVVTIGAILAMAAHVDGKGAGMMEMAGSPRRAGRCGSTAAWPSAPRTSARSASPPARPTR